MTTEQFGTLVRQYEKLVYTICYQFTRDAALAEDLAQETFLAAFTHRDDCSAAQYKPWLARIATNKAKDYLKSAYHRRVDAADDETLDASPLSVAQAMQTPQPEDISITRDETAAIRAEIEALPEPYHQPAVRYFLAQQSVEEIAAALERPVKTVHTQLYRAKHMLRETLTKRRSVP